MSSEYCELFRHVTLSSRLIGPHSFRTFGPLRYARITMDHETGRSRGTGFVCFWNVEDADKAIEKSELLHLETTGSTSTVCSVLSYELRGVLAVLIGVD
jgi:hypothetical protein